MLGPNGLGNLSDQALHAQLEELGMLASTEPGRYTKVVRTGPKPGDTARVLQLRPGALTEAEG